MSPSAAIKINGNDAGGAGSAWGGRCRPARGNSGGVTVASTHAPPVDAPPLPRKRQRVRQPHPHLPRQRDAGIPDTIHEWGADVDGVVQVNADGGKRVEREDASAHVPDFGGRPAERFSQASLRQPLPKHGHECDEVWAHPKRRGRRRARASRRRARRRGGVYVMVPRARVARRLGRPRRRLGGRQRWRHERRLSWGAAHGCSGGRGGAARG